MYLIKKCPNCSRKLRFPIDRGKIRVSCSCGESFLADPDDTSLYSGAAFDLEPEKDRRHGPVIGPRINLVKQRLKILFASAIRHGYEMRYRLQNFSLLPTGEQRKIVIALLLLLLVMCTLGYFICATGTPAPGDGVI